MIEPLPVRPHHLQMIAPFVLLIFVVAYRIVLGISGMHEMQWLHNFSPIAAVALCGAVYLPRRVAIVLPMLGLLLSDIALNIAYHIPFFTLEIIPHYCALAMIAVLGFKLRGKVGLGGLLCASFAGSVLFYVLTNTGSWLSNPIYAKTFAGWVQALTVGDGAPEHPSTLAFYRHTLVSDLLFTLLFERSMALTSRKTAQVAAEPALAR